MIDFRKITEEDPEFKEFMLKVNEAMLFNDPNFTAAAMFMYALYQSGINADVAIATMLNFQSIKKAAE